MITFLCKYYIVLSDTLVGSFLDVLFVLICLLCFWVAMGGILCVDIMSEQSKVWKSLAISY